eukprot:Polyplicarium_translucidae@DN3362_c0_g1_i3.p1
MDGLDWSMGSHGYIVNESIWKPYQFGADLFDMAIQKTDKTIDYARLDLTASTHGAMIRIKWPAEDTDIDLNQTRYVKIFVGGCKETSYEVEDGKMHIKARGHQFQGGNVSNLEKANLYLHFVLDKLPMNDGSNGDPPHGRCPDDPDDDPMGPTGPSDDLGGGVKMYYATSVTEVNIRVGISLVSYELAKLRLGDQIPDDKDFDALRDEHKTKWETHLGAIKIDDSGFTGQQEDDLLDVFYSSLYRASIFPRNLGEMNGDSTPKMVHWSPVDPEGGVYDGPYSADSGFWDSYHTMFTILQVLWPTRLSEIIDGYVNAYNECGWIPQWAAPGHGWSMVGTMSDSAFGDCIVKGFTDDYDVETILKSMKTNAFTEPPVPPTEGPDKNPRGRRGIPDYSTLGWITREGSDNFGHMEEPLGQTLNHAMADWSIAQAANAVAGQKVFTAEEIATLESRADNWKKVWDEDLKHFHLKDKDGVFYPHFDEWDYGMDLTEGNHWQYRFHAWQNVDGLAEKYGGITEMCDAIHEFNTQFHGYVHAGTYGHGWTHEMLEKGVSSWGQAPRNNQTSKHIQY